MNLFYPIKYLYFFIYLICLLVIHINFTTSLPEKQLQSQESFDSIISFLQIADWGGSEHRDDFINPSQLATSNGMELIANQLQSQFIIALGDNFYSNGIQTNEFDIRFQITWENVYNTSALRRLSWYMNMGNHDHRGVLITLS